MIQPGSDESAPCPVDFAEAETDSSRVTAAAFDTHSSVKTLTAAGMPEAQAEAVTALLKASRDADLGALATKTDLAETKADLRRDLAETKADILKWMIGMIGGAVVINAATVVGAMLALIRIVGR